MKVNEQTLGALERLGPVLILASQITLVVATLLAWGLIRGLFVASLMLFLDGAWVVFAAGLARKEAADKKQAAEASK